MAIRAASIEVGKRRVAAGGIAVVSVVGMAWLLASCGTGGGPASPDGGTAAASTGGKSSAGPATRGSGGSPTAASGGRTAGPGDGPMTGSGGAPAASPSPASTGGHGGSDAGSAGAPPVGMGPPNVAPVGHGVGASGCPAGPFPVPTMLSSASVCADFPFAYDSNEGPTWVASQGAFFFSNYAIQQASGGDIIKYTPGGACELFIQGVGCNGLAVTADGNLLAACQQSRSLVLFDVKTRLGTTVVDNYQGMAFDSPNDLVIHTNGTIYFTNPQFELGGRTPGVGLATFRIDPAGAISLIAPGACNGIALSPDQSKLYVLTFGQAAVWDLDPAGVPSNRGSMGFGGDGMAVDCAGNIYVSGGIYTGAGQRIGAYVQGGTNLAFGGADGTTLLVVGFGQPVRELKMNVPGLP